MDRKAWSVFKLENREEIKKCRRFMTTSKITSLQLGIKKKI
jgi:hypothetical protein